ncbi:MAG: hypothetical protein KDA93_03865 [Planctomycetaceae bacterium]|nr:hypothetical protein [Planctomycetaceae bacterium]
MISTSWIRTSLGSSSLCLVIVASLVGCAGTKERDVLESRLRHQEDMLASYQAQIDRTKTELDIAKREAASLRQQLASSEKEVPPTEHVDASFRTIGIEFSTLMTGGTNINSSPGDDGLTVVLLPKDPDGVVVKVAGTIEIEAFDLARPEGAQRIGQWTFDVGESHEYWHQGVIQSGYQFELPWQEIPQAEQLLLHGRLVSIDGRQFDTTHTVSIEPPDATLVGGSRSSDAPPSTIKQLSGFEESPSEVRPALAESSSDDWEDESPQQGAPIEAPARVSVNEPSPDNPFGHSPAVQPRIIEARAMTGREFKDQLNVGSPLTVDTPSSRIPSPPTSSKTAPPFSKEFELSRAMPVSLETQPQSKPVAKEPNPFEEPQPFPVNVPQAGSVSRESPPPIQDVPQDADEWWDADDWPHEASTEPTSTPVRTSDVWTDETIPYRR